MNGALLTSDNYAQGLFAGNLSSDGRLDIAMAEFYTDTIILARQQPNGTFGPGSRITSGPGIAPHDFPDVDCPLLTPA